VRLAWERASERRALTENRELLLQELYHRLHNNLQMVLSLLSLTARDVPDASSREQILDLKRRIQALSSLQEQFYRSPDFRRVEFSGYLESLARNLMSLAGGRVHLEVLLDPVELPVDVAVPLGLVANELIMNALKHAFPDSNNGRLEITLRREADRVNLRVADNGVGLRVSSVATPSGLGARLVAGLAAQLGTDVQYEELGEGLACTIRLKV
jgi:two-component sensor histidine kinase